MMRKLLLIPLTFLFFLIPHLNYGQAPSLGAASDFVLFTGAGAFSVNGNSTNVTGDVGTRVGAFIGFPPGVLNGTIHVADPESVAATTAVNGAYAFLSGLTCGQVLATPFGGGQILTPNVYCVGSAADLSGDLILDGECDPNAIFVFKIGGALSTTTFSNVILINGASICNVYWQVGGAFELGGGSVFRGNLIGDGAIELLEGSSLFGRALTRTGAIALHNNFVDINNQGPSPSVITAGGPTTFCAGGSVTLSGNCGGVWSNGATTSSITVTTSGSYTVTNSNSCGSATSNTIVVTVNPLPVCTITGATSICFGQSTQLCAPAGAASYLWSNGGTSNCITVSAAGTYTVTVTASTGCTNVCSTTVMVSAAPVCTITGNTSICAGQSTQLCAPAGAASYLWSNGGTTNCITVSTAGTYTVTVTNAAGCSSVCSQAVTVNPLPVCTITGATSICAGQSTQLCVPAGAASYLWSTGATTNCIAVSATGAYSVTVTSAAGCSSVCSVTVNVNPLPICTITGNTSICAGQSTQLCVPAGAASYLWSNGATTNCITVNTAGTYAVTVTNAAGCSSVCSQAVIVTPLPICTITGNLSICQGQSTLLCVPAGAASYLWSTGATTNCITVSASGNYSVTVTNAAGCSSVCNATVNVNPLPVCTITGNPSICAGQSTQLCVPAGAASYLWSTGATTNCITVNTAGTYAVTVTNAAGCSSVCSQAVIVTPLPICTITGGLSICQGQSTQLCVPAGAASYLWSNGQTSNCITVSAAGNYSVTVTSAAGCSSVCNATVNVNPLPICTITGNPSICAGQSTQLCVPAGAASYLWSNGQTTNCITVNTAGTYAVTVTNADGCSSVCSQAVTVVPPPVCTISGNLSICSGQSTLLCVPAGATSYLWNTGATTNCITVNTAGTYAVTVTNMGGCSSVCSVLVVMPPPPVCTITGDNSICQGQSTQLCVPAGSASYLWNTGATTNCITVSTAGIYTVIVTDASGCSSVCSTTVTVNPLPVCTITGDDFVCAPGQLTQICVPPGAASYLWSTGETTNCITVSAGTYSVTVTSENGCSSVCTKIITVNPTPVCTITGDDFICAEGESTELCVAPGAIAYLWSTGATTNCITINTAGTYSVTVTNAGGCTSICSKTVIVNPLTTCTITGNDFICEGQSTQICVPAGATAYLWSTGATTNCISVNAAGTYSVTITSANGCNSICSLTVSMVPLPICTITGNDFICAPGQTTQLCVPAGAASYLWSTGAMTNCITVNAAGLYSVTVTNASGCSSVCSQTVVINPPPICTITGDDFLCEEGQMTELCVPAGAASYLWSTGATTNCITVNAAGTYAVTVTDENGCSSVCSKTVIVNPLPICTITGDNLLCEGQTTQLCVPAGATSYLWSTGAMTNCITVNAAGLYSVTVTNASGCSSVCSQMVVINPPPICTITGDDFLCEEGQMTELCVPAGAASYLWSTGATTNCITVNAAGTYVVTVTDENGCSSICSKTVIVNPLPICTITGDDLLCEGQTTQLCVPAGSGTYLWSTGATTNCISVNVAGEYFVTVTSLNGCKSICSKIVTLNPTPICMITGNDIICEGQTTQLCVPAGAMSYLWSNGATTNCITVNTAGTYVVTVTDENGCTSICSKTVIVNPLPLCTITGDGFICLGESTQLCVPAGATSYLWSNGATTNCITVNTAGTYVVTVTYSSGCSSICSKTVVVSPQPVCTISGVNFICEVGQTTQLCVPAGAASYFWSTGETTNCITVSTAGTYTVTVTSANGCSSVCSEIVTVNPLPVCVITGDDFICEEGQLTQLCVPAGAASYLWSTGATTNCIIASATGTYSVTVTASNGCSSVCSKTIFLNLQPSCTITGNGFICTEGQTTQLCVPPGAASYLWSNGATTNCILVSTPGTYSVTVTASNGCTSVCSKTVVVDPLPTCIITGDHILCEGETTQLCVPPGAVSYWWSTGAMTNCITVSTPGTYSVTVTYASGCTSVCSTTVTVSPAPVCAILGDCVIPCGGQPILLCAPAGCESYWWSTGATTQCIVVTTPGVYSLTITNAAGCSSVCTRTVVVGQAPPCQITGNCVITCGGPPAQLCAPAGCLSYWWSTGAMTQCISVNTPGTYSVTITYANGCSSVCCVTVTQGYAPVCVITGCTSMCGGQPTPLCAPPGCSSYWWSTGETTSCILACAPGNYSVTVTYPNGCISTACVTVTQPPPPTCIITGNCVINGGQPTLLCAPAGCINYLWSTGATTSCILAGTPGIYSVTVTNANGCTSVCWVTVTGGHQTPVCEIAGNHNICEGQTTMLCAPSGYIGYVWSTGATTSCILVNTAGVYAVTATDANGTTVTGTRTVIVTPPPVCVISGNSSICGGQPMLLCATPGATSYLWSTGATTSCIMVTAAGVYAVTTTNGNGCSSTCSKTVTVGASPACTITSNLVPGSAQTTILCVPFAMTTYLWSTGDTSRCITVDTSGSFSVTVTDASGCSSTCNSDVSYLTTDTSQWDGGPIGDGYLDAKIYPNPFTETATVEFVNMVSSSHVVIELYRLSGTKITTLFEQDIEKGKIYRTAVTSESLADGVYICRIVNGAQIINKKLVLIK